MAKIAFFTERLPSSDDEISLFSASLIHSLADQHHDIRVYTTNDDHEWHHSHSRIEIVRPFKNWSWWETAKLLPLLIIDAPEIVHVIQPRYESIKGFGPSALNFLAALPSFPTRPKLIVSIYEFDKRSIDKFAPLLTAANLILVRTETQRNEISEGWKIDSRKIEVLPALSLPALTQDSEAVPENLSFLAESEVRFIYIPGGLDQHSDLERLFRILKMLRESDENLWFVMEGSISDLQISKRAEWQKTFEANPAAAKTIFTGKLSSSAENYLLQSALLSLLATLDPQKLKFWRHSRRALQLGSPIVLSRSQVNTDELNWVESGLAVVAQESTEIVKAVLDLVNDESARMDFRSRAVELADRQVTDRPANHLTRLYLDLLNRR